MWGQEACRRDYCHHAPGLSRTDAAPSRVECGAGSEGGGWNQVGLESSPPPTTPQKKFLRGGWAQVGEPGTTPQGFPPPRFRGRGQRSRGTMAFVWSGVVWG